MAKSSQNETIGNINSIETLGLLDGPGVRVVVFMQGCPLRCIYCHNPETWHFDEKKTTYTVSQLIAEIEKYTPYFGKKGGVTFSGGEPLLQKEFVLECLKALHAKKINTCIDTSGFITNVKDVLKYTDLVLLDIKGLTQADYYLITGTEQNNFHDFVKECEETNTPIWLRYVLVPTINDSSTHIEKLAQLYTSIKTAKKIELLAYHKLGDTKYQELNINNPMFGMDEISHKKLNACKRYLNKQIKEQKVNSSK